MKRPYKIFLTGGHLGPALALIETIQKEEPAWEIVWIGRRYIFDQNDILSEEARLAHEYHIRFLSLTAGRITRVIGLHTVLSLLKIPIGFIQALWFCLQSRPNCIVSLGGYIALPVAVAGWLFGIPVITHEQTKVPGLANTCIGRVSRRVFVTFPETVQYFPAAKVKVTGALLRPSLFTPPVKPSFTFPRALPLLYITGGSTGATRINALMFPIVETLVEKYAVIHQTGRLSVRDANKCFQALPKKYQSRYLSFPYVSATDVSWIFHRATLIIGRSGANTVMELASLGKIGILVPLPWSAGHEQYENARMLAAAGTVRVLDQKTTTPQELLKTIEEVTIHKRDYQKRAVAFSRLQKRDGARAVVTEIGAILRESA